jgi:hypothetical protein
MRSSSLLLDRLTGGQLDGLNLRDEDQQVPVAAWGKNRTCGGMESKLLATTANRLTDIGLATGPPFPVKVPPNFSRCCSVLG